MSASRTGWHPHKDYDRGGADNLVRMTVQEPTPFRGPHGASDGAPGLEWIDDGRHEFHLYGTRERAAGWEYHHYASNYRGLFRSELTGSNPKRRFCRCTLGDAS